MSKRLIICADVEGHTGYGLHLTKMVSSFVGYGYDVKVRPTRFSEHFNSKVDDIVKERLVWEPQPERWELLLHYPTFTPNRDKDVAYFTMAESTEPSPEQVENINLAKFAIVPCQWNAQCFRDKGVRIPIYVVPLGYDEKIFTPSPIPSDGPCVFGTAGRLKHGVSRKGTNVVIDCFLKAFPNKENVKLIVKGWPDCAIRKVNDDRITYIQEYLRDDQMAGFLASLTCYVSAARGEGFGLIQLEACAAGRPVIASIYGGLAEFLNNRNSISIPFKIVDADENYKDRGKWALPSTEHIIGSMREMYEHRDRAQAIGKLAAVSVQHLTWDKSHRALEAILKSNKVITYPKKQRLVFNSVWGNSSGIQEVVIRRSAALGDVVAATCVAEKLVSFGCTVRFQAVKACHPILEYTEKQFKYEEPSGVCHIDLDGAYENHPERRTKTFSQIYMETANRIMKNYGVDLGSHLQTTPSMSVNPLEQDAHLDFLEKYPRPWVMVCPRSGSWPNRTIPNQVWSKFKTLGTQFWIGTDNAPVGYIDLQVRSVDALIRWISCADLVVSPDTGPSNIAAALKIPSLIIGQASDPKLHVSDQRDWIGFYPDMPCLNCQADCIFDVKTPPCQNIDPHALSAAATQKLRSLWQNTTSAVIPVYKTNAVRLNRCLTHVFPQVDEVIISVDGDGKLPDGITLINHPKVKVVRNWTGEQLGYGRNANYGARHTSGHWILFLNDDVYLDDGYVGNLMAAANDQTGVAAGLLYYGDRKLIQHGGTRRAGSGWGHIDHLSSKPTITETCEMENVTHAAVLVRRTAFYEAGAYPEHLAVGYWEDNWLNLAIRKLGYKVIYCPKATGLHDEHQTTSSLGREGFEKVVATNRDLFMREWEGYFEHNKNSELGNFDYIKKT
jgi:GT2 family glycosyltransferase/glycosyltransferase involved in cell wall biosynthesis